MTADPIIAPANSATSSSTRAAWDSIWTEQLDSAWEPLLHPIRMRIMAPAVLRAIPSEAIIFPSCEVGAGRAAASFLLGRQMARHVIALDLSHVVTRRIRAESDTRIAGVTGSAFSLPFRDRALGLAFNISTLEHFPDPIPVLKEMGRSARFVFVAVPAASRTWRVLLKMMNRLGYEGTGEFYRLYDEALLRAHLLVAGLDLITLRKIRFLGIFPFWVATARADAHAD